MSCVKPPQSHHICLGAKAQFPVLDKLGYKVRVGHNLTVTERQLVVDDDVVSHPTVRA